MVSYTIQDFFIKDHFREKKDLDTMVGEMEGKGIEKETPDPLMLYFVKTNLYNFLFISSF